MSYPAYPPQQQPQYPPQQPGYPPQQAPQYYPPQAPSYYPPQQAPQYPPAQQPQFAQPLPAAPVAAGDISDFYDQPAASGKSISFNGKPPGTTYAGMVARTITKADIQVQTDMLTKQASKHPDGRLKYTMIVPLLLQPSAEFPDGRACYYFKHNEKPELERAMEAAGAPAGTPPEQGAMITITYIGDRPVPGMSPQKMKSVTYTRPQGAVNGNGQQPAAANNQAAFLAEQIAPGTVVHGVPQPGPDAMTHQQAIAGNDPRYPAPGTAYQPPPVQYAPDATYAVQPQFQQAPVPPAMPYQGPYAVPSPPAQAPAFQPPAQPQPAPQGMPQPVAGLSEAQQKLLAQLTGPEGQPQ